jgi:hypothetical protein
MAHADVAEGVDDTKMGEDVVGGGDLAGKGRIGFHGDWLREMDGTLRRQLSASQGAPSIVPPPGTQG